MVSEVKVLCHFDDMVFLLMVLSEKVGTEMKGTFENTHPFPQIIQDLDFNQGLVMEAFLVSNDLDGHRFTRAVVAAVQDLTKRAFTQNVDDLVAVG